MWSAPELSGGQFGPFIKVQKLVFRKSAKIEKNVKVNISLVSKNGFFSYCHTSLGIRRGPFHVLCPVDFELCRRASSLKFEADVNR